MLPFVPESSRASAFEAHLGLRDRGKVLLLRAPFADSEELDGGFAGDVGESSSSCCEAMASAA